MMYTTSEVLLLTEVKSVQTLKNWTKIGRLAPPTVVSRGGRGSQNIYKGIDVIKALGGKEYGDFLTE